MKLEEKTGEIIGAAMEVSNAIGHGFHEKIYENALVVELKIREVEVEQQRQFPVLFKSIEVGKFIPDLICYGQIVVDTKTIAQISKHETGQMLNYLRITGLKVGLIINFKHAKLEWKRVVL